jgi:uncharacterized membrane-anchored protein YhcB (DUF1043 family)
MYIGIGVVVGVVVGVVIILYLNIKKVEIGKNNKP